MPIQHLKFLYKRDLDRLEEEISQYKSEEKLWYTEKGIANSGGNLCLHLVGNLNTFIGKALGNTGYVRDREFEFAGKGVPKEELLRQVVETREIVLSALDQLDGADLAQNHPMTLFGKEQTTEFMILQMAVHLSYHLGQINYHRRLLDAGNDN